jgi:tRNA G18 (ribose-2'-O)-methylase SpoU
VLFFMNVLDDLKNNTVEENQAYYKATACQAAVAMTHMHGDFNFSNVVRSANFFGFKWAMYVGGSRQWDRRGAVGTHHYIPLIHCETVDAFWAAVEKEGLVPIALECNVTLPNRLIENIFEFQWPKKSLIIVGEEQAGLSVEILEKCQHIVFIPAFGTVRSMNVGTAAGIAMAQYRRNHYFD